MKKYFIAACCLVSMAAISQACNESKEFNTETFQLLCETTGGSVQEGDETHCYCSNTKCEAGFVCDKDKQCMKGTGSNEQPSVNPNPNDAPVCNADNKDKSFCLVSNGSAAMNTCNGTNFVPVADGACKSNKCKSDYSACEEDNTNVSNEPVCDSEQDLMTERCVEENGKAKIQICSLVENEDNPEPLYEFLDKLENGDCASNKCNDDKTACAPVDVPECGVDNEDEVKCVVDSEGNAHLEICKAGEDEDGQPLYSFENKPDGACPNGCNDDKNGCADDATSEVVCNADNAEANLKKCVDDSDGSAHLEICAYDEDNKEYAFSPITENGACDNGCNNDHTDCEAVVVTKPVCDENTGSKEICDVVDGQATMMICQSDGQDGYEWVAKQDGACGDYSCNDAGTACKICDVNETKCEIVEDNAVVSKCNDTQDAFEPANLTCELNQCSEDNKGCLVCNEDNYEDLKVCIVANESAILYSCIASVEDTNTTYSFKHDSCPNGCNNDGNDCAEDNSQP